MMLPHAPAPSATGDFWGITAIFEPVPSPYTLPHLARFSAGVRRQGLPLAIAELAFGDAPFRVPATAGDIIVRLRSDTLLWHKERLLNLLIAALPDTCRFVTWLDADILFERDTWVDETRQALDTAPVVQPFETACWLGADDTTAPHGRPEGVGEGHELRGMAATLAGARDRRKALLDYLTHGHTGFAWAARRDLVARHGLYDRNVVGLGDFITAHALAGNGDFIRGRHFVSRELTRAERCAIEQWGLPLVEETGGDVAWIPGRVLHLYHGDISGRRYTTRNAILQDAAFDPVTDIALDAHGLWRWDSEKPALHRAVARFLTGPARGVPDTAASAT